jgi:hypothetical protein
MDPTDTRVEPEAAFALEAPPAVTTHEAPPKKRGTLLKQHRFAVTFPDGTEGACAYERFGPAYHLFCHAYGDGTPLPRQYHARPLGNRPEDVEAKGRELATAAFCEAVERERRDRFARVTPPTDGSRKPDPALFRLSPADAKRHGGRYALCLPMPASGRLVRSSRTFATLSEANFAWEEVGDRRLVVACCNRLDRCWQAPKYNPLYAKGAPKC